MEVNDQKHTKAIPKLGKSWTCGRDDVPGSDDEESFHPPMIAVIIYASEKSVVTMLANFITPPQKLLCK